RLHALYASAQVFRLEPLTGALKDVLTLIDKVREQRRGFTQEELDQLANLAATLPKLGEAAESDGGGSEETPSVIPEGPREVAPKRKAPPPTPASAAARKPRVTGAPRSKRSVD